MEIMMIAHLPNRIVSTRHPQCLHNVAYQEALMQGIPNLESPLTDVGEAQRDIVADYLMSEFGSFDKTLATEFGRTHTIPFAAGLNIDIAPAFNERSMGVWHKLPAEQVLLHYPGENIPKGNGYYHYKAPEGGETCTDVVDRETAYLKESANFNGVDTLLISGHGISGLCLRLVLMGESIDVLGSYERLKNASVTVYERQGSSFAITMYNHAPWEGLIDTKQGSEA